MKKTRSEPSTNTNSAIAAVAEVAPWIFPQIPHCGQGMTQYHEKWRPLSTKPILQQPGHSAHGAMNCHIIHDRIGYVYLNTAEARNSHLKAGITFKKTPKFPKGHAQQLILIVTLMLDEDRVPPFKRIFKHHVSWALFKQNRFIHVPISTPLRIQHVSTIHCCEFSACFI